MLQDLEDFLLGMCSNMILYRERGSFTKSSLVLNGFELSLYTDFDEMDQFHNP